MIFVGFDSPQHPSRPPLFILVAFSVVTETENKPHQFVVLIPLHDKHYTPLFHLVYGVSRLHGPMLRGSG